MPLANPKEKTVLIVDDDVHIVDLLVHIVKKEGFQFATAGDGEEGIRVIEKIRPQIVILDLMMPRYGGYDVLRQLQSGEYSQIPIIAMTAFHRDPSTEEMIRQESNVAAFMKKPINLQELVRLLHRVLKTQPNDDEDLKHDSIE